ncbi:MAG: cell division initiation protein [Marinoscillum sp.]|jgi:cell division initiation protein
MKITPLEIRQKNFEKKLRGYDKDEVSAFLISMSNEWERMLDDNKEMKIKLAHADKEVQKLREVESSLFKTLKTAEDTGANLVDQANRAAELHLKESQMNADAMMGEAKSKAKNIIEKAEMEARMLIEEMQDAIKDLEQHFRGLENHKENIIGELRNLADDVHERIKRSEKNHAPFKLEDHTKRVKALMRESEAWIIKEKLEVKPVKLKPLNHEDISARPKAAEKVEVKKEVIQERVAEKKPLVKPASKPAVKADGSFFDELD